MSKILLAAALVRDFEFDSWQRFELYLYQLEHNGVVHKVLESFERADGSVVARIVTQFGHYDLPEL